MAYWSRTELGCASAFFNPRGGGVLPYMGYIGMCGAKGYSVSAALVINRVSILAILAFFFVVVVLFLFLFLLF